MDFQSGKERRGQRKHTGKLCFPKNILLFSVALTLGPYECFMNLKNKTKSTFKIQCLKLETIMKMNVKHAELVSLTHQASAAAEHELSSCCSRSQSLGSVARGARAQLPHGMWDLPVPEIKPMSPALAGGFLTTVLSGMPKKNSYFKTSCGISQNTLPINNKHGYFGGQYLSVCV